MQDTSLQGVMLLILFKAGCANIFLHGRMENSQVGGPKRVGPWQRVSERAARWFAYRNPSSRAITVISNACNEHGLAFILTVGAALPVELTKLWR